MDQKWWAAVDIAETVRTDKRIGASNYELIARSAWVYCPFGVTTRLLGFYLWLVGRAHYCRSLENFLTSQGVTSVEIGHQPQYHTRNRMVSRKETLFRGRGDVKSDPWTEVKT